jgi:FkbM family methyltransferase
MQAAANTTTQHALSTCVWARARVGTAGWDMCTYPRSVDRWVSAAVQRTGCWIECADVEWMLTLLGRWPRSELLDLGGNIGFYTGAAAAAGHAVRVFEPSPDNAMHLLATVRQNAWRHVRLFTLCVSDASGPCALSGHRDNQGSLQHDMGSPPAVSGARRPPASRPAGWRRGAVTTMATRVDDVLPPRQQPTFLKVDIEGSECAAFRGMRTLLNSSTAIVGALVEFDKISCCSELISQPSGAFWVLAHRHGLCAYQAPVAKPVHARPTPLSNLCELRGGKHQLNIRWETCQTPG